MRLPRLLVWPRGMITPSPNSPPEACPVFKTLVVAVLLLPTFVLAQSHKTPTSPLVVAKGKLLNQTANIPTTTIFTPPQSGLYRLSVYGTLTTAGAVNASSNWLYTPSWTDDSGVLTNAADILFSNNGAQGPFVWSQVNSIGATILLEAKGGTAITYSVTQDGPPDGSVYSLYYALERLD